MWVKAALTPPRHVSTALIPTPSRKAAAEVIDRAVWVNPSWARVDASWTATAPWWAVASASDDRVAANRRSVVRSRARAVARGRRPARPAGRGRWRR